MRRRFVYATTLMVPLALACSGDKVEPPVPKSLTPTTSTSMQAVAGNAVPEKPSIVVKDQRGNPMANVVVTFAAVQGGGSVVGATQTTSPTGVATVGNWVLGTAAGINALTASAGTVTPVTFSATGIAGPAAAIVKTSVDGQTATVGSAVPVAPSVTVTDGNGNPVAGTLVTFAVTTGGGTVTGESVTTGGDGVAIAGIWTLGTTAGLNTLSAASATLAPAEFTATGVAGAAAKLGLVTEPSGAMVNVPLTTQPVVHVRDEYDNLVTTATTSVTAALATGAGTLGGTVTVSAVAGVATFANLVLTGLTADGNARLRFTAGGLTEVQSGTFATFVSEPNLTIDGVYITQATQTYDGAVPLVAARRGLIRVFVKASRPNTLAPAVRVRLYQQGSLVQTYTIAAPGGSVPTQIAEAPLTASWNVSVPANVMQPGLLILADVDPAGNIAEPSETDNFFPSSGEPKALDVRTASTFAVTLVPVIQAGNGLQGDVTEANKATYMDFASRVYPISSYDAVVRAPYTYSGTLASSYGNTWTALLGEMMNLRSLDGSTRYYYGVIKPAYSSGGTGFGFVGQPAAIGVDWTTPVEPGTTLRSMTAAHEWGHNFNRRHVNCGNPSGLDLSYPYEPSSIGVYGYDLEGGALRSTDLADLMSYCRPLWISDYTYKSVLSFRAGTGGASTSGGARRSMLIWGHVGPNGLVLEPAFEIDAPPLLPTRTGPFRIQAVDAAGRDVFNFSFEGTAVDHAPERLFTFIVPLSAGQGRPVKLSLTANGREAVRRSTLQATPLGNAPLPPPALARLSAAPGTRSRLEWDAASYPMALVRDAATGQILSFARGGRLDIAVPGRELDVTFSDGVASVRQRIPVSPR